MRFYLIAINSLLFLIVIGCIGPTEIVKDEEIELLRIGYHSEQNFEHRYSALLQVEAPHLRYEIVPMNELILQKMTVEQWNEKYQADLLYIPSRLFPEFIRQNLLIDLNPLIATENYPIDCLVPSVIQFTKRYGDGNMYGIPPTFYSWALIFNKDMFDEMHVEYARDLMTWEDVIILASHFDKGLSLPYPTLAHWIVDVGRAMNWDIHDENGVLTLDSKEWELFFKIIREQLEQDTITFDDINQKVFSSGEYAMALITYDDYLYIESLLSEHNWEIVTAPVNPTNLDKNLYLSVDGFFSIPDSSQNIDLAWNLIELFTSKDTAKWEYRMPYGFSISDPSVFATDSDQLEAFYKLVEPEIREVIPNNVYAEINHFIDEYYGVFMERR